MNPLAQVMCSTIAYSSTCLCKCCDWHKARQTARGIIQQNQRDATAEYDPQQKLQLYDYYMYLPSSDQSSKKYLSSANTILRSTWRVQPYAGCCPSSFCLRVAFPLPKQHVLQPQLAHAAGHFALQPSKIHLVLPSVLHLGCALTAQTMHCWQSQSFSAKNTNLVLVPAEFYILQCRCYGMKRWYKP